MHHWHTISRLVLLALLTTLAACGGPGEPVSTASGPADNPSPDQATLSPLPTNAAGERLVARVNGAEITLPALEHALARRQLEQSGTPADTLRAETLNQLIEGALILQGAQAQGLTISDEQLAAELQSNREMAGSDEAWNKWLQDNGYTQEEYLSTLRLILTTNLVRDKLTADLTGTVRQVHARHILLRTEAEAQQALARLNAGADFAALAGELSQDEITRSQGGDLGWFTQEELFVPELAAAAFSLPINQIGGPIATELGYHIVQTLETGDREIEPDRRVYIAQARFANWLEPLYRSAVIERFG